MSPRLLASLMVLATGSSHFDLAPIEDQSFGFNRVGGFPAGVSVNEAPYRSDAFGFEIAFPPGSIACAGFPGFFNRNYNAFYAWYDSGSATCASLQPRSGMAVLGMRADLNASEQPIDELVPGDCLDGPDLGMDIAPIRTLSFPGKASRTCVTRGKDGSIEIEVLTQGEEPMWPGGPSIYNYRATLSTDPARLGTNLAKFRTFLASARFFPRLRD